MRQVLEAGIGTGRLIPELAPLVKTLVGIDNAKRMLEESRRIAKNFQNVEIKEMNMEEVAKFFPEEYFDFSLCIWNTLGNVIDEKLVLNKLRKVTKNSIIITTHLKGALEERKNWYQTVGVEMDRIDEKNEIFYSKSGLKSKSFSPNDMKFLGENTKLKVKESKILADVVLWTEYEIQK